MTRRSPVDAAAVAASQAVTADVLAVARAGRERVSLVDSPPGAGKSTLVRAVAAGLARDGRQIPIVSQTNEQADDLVRDLSSDLTGTHHSVGRLHNSSTYEPPDDLRAEPRIALSSDIAALQECSVIVAPAKKWAFIDSGQHSWPLGIIDEAYQMRGGDALAEVAELFDSLLAVGDPGQLSPFTTGDESLIRGIERSPLASAANVLLNSHPNAYQRMLPVSWRLAPQAAELVSRAFYSAQFRAGTTAGARRLQFSQLGNEDPLDRVLGHAADSGWGLLELPQAYMPVDDADAVQALAELVCRALTAQGRCRDEHDRIYGLDEGRIAVGVTHTAQKRRVRAVLDQMLSERGFLPGAVVVDTANRLQGRQFELVFAWHPLSGRHDTSSFHIEAGRLCVLLSRHRQACVLVTRAGLEAQLEAHPQPEPLWLGERQLAVDGWEANLSVLEQLAEHRIAA
ncbi:AAA family ATPase [Pseudonocardia sp. RS010]|uniref:AAA family ATPase n=1 Tax=Pseudonocardia sp. RS010 TaxID=3385979 RepID=UPI0039A1F41A